MPTDTTTRKQHPRHALTVADLCEAISSGEITPITHNGDYEVSVRALRQLRQAATVAHLKTPVATLPSYMTEYSGDSDMSSFA